MYFLLEVNGSDYSRSYGHRLCGVDMSWMLGSSASRIFGDKVITPHSLPWQVGPVDGSDKRPFCGGTLIDNEWILTAAHCFYDGIENPTDIRKVKVAIAEHNTTNDADGEYIAIAKKIEHPKYKRSTHSFHFALVMLDTSVEIKVEIIRICIPEKNPGVFNNRKRYAYKRLVLDVMVEKTTSVK